MLGALSRAALVAAIALATGCSGGDDGPTGEASGGAGAGGQGGTNSEPGGAGTNSGGMSTGDCRSTGCREGETCSECLGDDGVVFACIPEGFAC